MKIKTSELTGAALDWAVAKALGIRTCIGRYEHTLTGPCILDADLVDMQTDGEQELKHSRSWAQGGPIIEREGISTVFQGDGHEWIASLWDYEIEDWRLHTTGPTPLIAAMRCFCCSKLGKEIDIPKELLKPAESVAELKKEHLEMVSPQPASVPNWLETTRFLTDVTTAADLLKHSRRDKRLAQRIDNFVYKYRMLAAAPATPEPPAFDHDAIGVFADNRFHVKPRDKRLFGWCVTAGDGEHTLYVGSKPDCENVARKLAGAFLDGAFYYSGLANAPQPPTLSPIEELTKARG